MLNSLKIDVRGLLAAAVLACAGCAGQLCRFPDDCAAALSQATVGWRLRDFCQGPQESCLPCDGIDGGYDTGYDPGHDTDYGAGHETGCDTSCDVHVYEDEIWLDEPRPSRRPRIKIGPPPVPYEPPLPPQFLLVPTSSQQNAR